MNELAPHQQRVVAEAQVLASNLEKLMAFGESDVFSTLPDQEQALLVDQSEIMDEYLEVLRMRIAGFRGFKVYTCHKQVLAKPMTRLEYSVLRGWDLPANENGDDAGFLVEYTDGGQANHPGFDGYISWSPEEVFQRGYAENA